MPKRFNFRFSAVIPTFKSCRSKDACNLPVNPIPSSLSLLPSSSDHSNDQYFNSNSTFSTSVSVGCGRLKSRFRSTSRSSLPGADKSSSITRSTAGPDRNDYYRWGKEEKWHVVDIDLRRDAKEMRLRSGRRKKKRTAQIQLRVRWSTSSAGSRGSISDDIEDVEEEKETEKLSTTDSSAEFSLSPHLKTRGWRKKKSRSRISEAKKKKKKKKKKGDLDIFQAEEGSTAPARLSAALQKKLVPEGKVRESYAVVKRSEDPYEDFKGSMMEMIVEKDMASERDLSEMLRCYLSLNARRHHRVILEAFAGIWDSARAAEAELRTKPLTKSKPAII